MYSYCLLSFFMRVAAVKTLSKNKMCTCSTTEHPRMGDLAFFVCSMFIVTHCNTIFRRSLPFTKNQSSSCHLKVAKFYHVPIRPFRHRSCSGILGRHFFRQDIDSSSTGWHFFLPRQGLGTGCSAPWKRNVEQGMTFHQTQISWFLFVLLSLNTQSSMSDSSL